MDPKQQNYAWLKDLALGQGGALFGVAEISGLKNRFLISPAAMKGLTYGVSVGVALSRAVLDDVKDRPTLLYKWHYRQANNLLDKIAFLITLAVTEKGFRALPIPASQIVDWENQRGHVSHRALGEAAGLGWRGKNNLLVNETYGSQFRLVSILTDLPLAVDASVSSDCGDCSRCVAVCPAGALGQSPETYSLEKCYGMLKIFARERGIGQYICGVCVRACPGKVRV